MDRSLVRQVGGAPRWLRITGIIAGAMFGGLLLWRCTRTSMTPCEWEVRNGDQVRAVEICQSSYRQTGNERYLVWEAKAHLYLGNLAEAEGVAHQLLSGSLPISVRGLSSFGDTHGILSYIALRQDHVDAARMHATIARIAHTLAGDERGLEIDVVSLSQAARQAGDFMAALEAADEALRLARRLGDPHSEVVAHMARADALRRMGDVHAAADTLRSGIERATEPCDKAWVRAKNGMCLIDAGQEGLAMVELAAATQANRRCGSHDVWTQVAMNEAWLLRWKDPAAALARLDEVAKSEGDGVEVQLLRGDLAADRGALAEADRYFTQAASAEPPDADWPWEIERNRAELAEVRGGFLDDWMAEYHYRRAIAMVAALRATARTRSAYLVSSHRGPYDGLIALLARQGRWRDVLAVILDLDASDMLRATADEAVVRDHASLSVDPTDASAARSAAMPTATVDAVLSAWRSRDLVIAIAPSRRQIGPGRERAYRLQISEGQVTGEDVGDANIARTSADALFADPGDQDAARAMGRLIVPSGPAAGTLHVLAIGSLGKVPLAALRRADGSLIIGSRPLVRVLALGATGAESQGAGPSVVLADPRGDLRSAMVEGFVIAPTLGPGTQIAGPPGFLSATRSQLWAAHDAALLHVAGHVGVRGRWRALLLADGEVDSAELVQRRVAPRIAVLAGCGSAAATDEEGWGSIAAALLESGTAVVIATDRSVGDAASLSLMRDFYAQPDWRTDPPRALARVQQALDARAATSSDGATKARSWAAFSVLGRPPTVSERGAPPQPP